MTLNKPDKSNVSVMLISWRSFKDPKAGGAETATYEHVSRWIKNHNAIIHSVSPPYTKGLTSEKYKGIYCEYVGLPLGDTVYKLMFTIPFFYLIVCLKYLFYYRKKVDIVIDQVHGLPYMTPLYVKKPKLVYIHEIAGWPIWNRMYPFPINKLGYWFEKLLFKFYTKQRFICVSNSTKQDLIEMGISEQNITVILNGVSLPVRKKALKKGRTLIMIFLNRVVRMKGIERALEVFFRVLKLQPNAVFWIVGKVDYKFKKLLQKRCKELGINDKVTFFGFVSEKEKVNLLSKAHVLINASYKEGWGLVNIEANSQGTPVVAFNVKGNIDSIIDGVTGYVVEDDNLDNMSSKICEIYNNVALRESALTHARGFSWDVASEKFYNKVIESINEQK